VPWQRSSSLLREMRPRHEPPPYRIHSGWTKWRFYADDPKETFMGVVLVARGREPLFAKGYGGGSPQRRVFLAYRQIIAGGGTEAVVARGILSGTSVAWTELPFPNPNPGATVTTDRLLSVNESVAFDTARYDFNPSAAHAQSRRGARESRWLCRAARACNPAERQRGPRRDRG
jgi:hypothetical protein